MNRLKMILPAILTVLALALCACSIAESGTGLTELEGNYSYIGGKGSYIDAEDGGLPLTDAEEEYGNGDDGSEGDALDEEIAANSRKLIRTASFTVETLEFDDSVAKIRAMVAEAGGYVEESEISNGSYYTSSLRDAYFSVRIPVSALDDFLNAAGDIGSVTESAESVTDVTLSYSDLTSRITALETQRDRLIEMLSEAESVSEMLEIQDQLSDVEYELESYASRLRLYDSQIEYSTVEITLREVRLYTEVVEEPETFWERLTTTFRSSLEGVGNFFVNLAVFIFGNLPALLVLAAFVLLAVLIIRRCVKKCRARRAAARLRAAVPIGSAETGKDAVKAQDTP